MKNGLFKNREMSDTIDIEIITSINQKINSGINLAELLSAIMNTATNFLNSEASSILLADPATEDLIFVSVAGEKSTVIQNQRIPRGKGIAGLTVLTKKPVLVNDVQSDPRFFNEIDLKSDFRTKNIIAYPMIVRENVVGVLEAVNSLKPHGFDNRDLEKARYLANQAAIAITNRRLLDDLNKRIEELSSLYEITQTISLAPRDDKLLKTIVSAMSKFLYIKRVSIALFSSVDSTLRIDACCGLPDNITKGFPVDMENTISGAVLKTADPFIVSDINSEMPHSIRKSGSLYHSPSFISVPILLRNKPIGVLNLSEKENRSTFEASDLQLAVSISGQIAEVYQNYLNQTAIEARKRLEQEINIAAAMQRKILPVIPAEYAGHSLKALNRPAKAVGGDFYDFIKLENDKYVLIMADISGKGIPAALFMGSARNILKAQAATGLSPSILLQNSNRLIYEDSEFGMFVTLFYALVDPRKQTLTYGNAGHNNQLLLRSSTNEIIKLQSSGKPLGISDTSAYEEKICSFEKNDILLLFTDGVVECFSEENMDIDTGEEHLTKILIENKNSGPAEIINTVREYAIKNPVEDDLIDDFTILIVKL